MLVVRSASESDLEAIFTLSLEAGPGMTTLKAERDALRARLAVTAASFAGDIAPADADYLFVLEDLATGSVCGVAAIKGAVGVHEPFYNYRISTSVHASPTTGVVNRVHSLHLSHDLSGASELCSLYLRPDYCKGTNGKLLSKARFLFLAQFPELFASTIFAEMRGFQDEQGRSPFWESVGRPFFQMDFHQADDLCGKGDRQFIEHLVPRLPLYTHLLGREARAAIGVTHADTAPARRLLEQEGLHFDGYIDIFDGGPVLQAKLDNLRAVRDSRLQLAATGLGKGDMPVLVGTTQRHRFRVALTAGDPQAGMTRLAKPVMDALASEPGVTVRVLPLYPTARGSEACASTAAQGGNE